MLFADDGDQSKGILRGICSLMVYKHVTYFNLNCITHLLLAFVTCCKSVCTPATFGGRSNSSHESQNDKKTNCCDLNVQRRQHTKDLLDHCLKPL